MISEITDPPSNQEKRRSLLENEIRTADDRKTGAIWKAPNQMSLEDQQRNSNINDRPAEGI